MLEETVGHLQSRQKKDSKFTYEIIIVDDGSRDNTVDIALEFAKSHKDVDLRVLALEKNRGKGGAVTQVCTRSVLRGSKLLNRAIYSHSFTVSGYAGCPW